jgi:hypothetical protein
VRGADGVRDKIAALLLDEVPTKIGLLRTAWVAIPGVSLPDLDEVSSGELTDNAMLAEYTTAIMVTNPRLLNLKMVDIEDGRPVYMTRYACRIYIWARGEDWPEAITFRDNLAVSARLALLEYPTLDNKLHGDTGYRLLVNTYTEEFGEPFRLANAKGRRVLAPAVLAIDLDCEETLADGSTREPLGVSETITTTATLVGPGQPLPEENDSGDEQP